VELQVDEGDAQGYDSRSSSSPWRR
jgi:hypothetical protein